MNHETLGSIIRAVMFSAAPVTAVELARYASDADPDVARLTHRCKTSDLGKKSEVAGSSTHETEHNRECR